MLNFLCGGLESKSFLLVFFTEVDNIGIHQHQGEKFSLMIVIKDQSGKDCLMFKKKGKSVIAASKLISCYLVFFSKD